MISYQTVRDAAGEVTKTEVKPEVRKETTMPDEPEDEPEKEEKAEPIDFDAEKVNELLDVLFRTKDSPAFLALNQVAQINLAIMSKEIQDELDKRAEEQRKRSEEEASLREAKARKEAQEKEKAA